MYQFVFSKGITIPFKIHGQYPHHHISLETSSSDEITEHHEHTLLIMTDDDSEVAGDYTMLNQLGSNKVHRCMCIVVLQVNTVVLPCRTHSLTIQEKVLVQTFLPQYLYMVGRSALNKSFTSTCC